LLTDDSDERFRKLIFPYLYDLFVHTSKSDLLKIKIQMLV